MKTSKAEEPTGAAVSPRDRAVQEKLEILKKDYRDLDTRKIQTETHIKNLEEELTRLLEARRRENERLVADYEEHIQGIKDRLADIDRQPGKEQDES